MAEDYSEYLAAHVLNERKLVNYRSVSRGLKVHGNLAKQMLFDFHHRQNSKRPGSVHATYLITGTKLQRQTEDIRMQDGEDRIMQSDPIFPGSSMPGQDETMTDATSVKSIVLVKEEQFEQAKATFEHITGVHIYSLQATGLSDMQTLTECNRSLATSYASEDPLKVWRQYGTIQNPHVKRRTGKAAPILPAAPEKKPTEPKTKPAAPAPKDSAPTKSASQDTKSASQDTKSDPPKPTGPKLSTIKRQDSSLFKSFAKSKPKKPTAPAPEPDSQDASMTGFSSDDDDDEAEAADSPAFPNETEPPSVPGGKTRKEREAELQAMMDAEDEAMPDADGEAETEEKSTRTRKGKGRAVVDDDGDNDDEEGDESDADSKAGANADANADADSGAIDKGNGKGAEDADAGQANVRVENGRRRGRRRVMKKRTVKDAEGYLVTKEEPAWESFSEEEPAPKKPKVEAAAAGASKSTTTTAAAGKKAAKPGQGNIMSFFSKK